MTRAEVVQCVLDIKAWFKRTKSKSLELISANEVQLQQLEKTIDTSLPMGLRELLVESNGGMYFMDKKQLSTKEIAEVVREHEGSSTWKNGIIPFCGDGSSFLVISTTDNDKVYEWDVDDGLGDLISSNLNDYLETYRNDLLESHFEFLDDVGVIEKMGKTKK